MDQKFVAPLQKMAVTPKHQKFRMISDNLSQLDHEISGWQQDIVYRKMVLQTMIIPTRIINLVNCGPQMAKTGHSFDAHKINFLDLHIPGPKRRCPQKFH